MAKLPFLEHIQQRPILADGAMGTMLHQSGVKLGRCFDELNLNDPAIVAKVHQQYLTAGANLLETNTFGANEFKLKQYGLENRVVDINEAAVDLLKRVIQASFRDDLYIGGSVGSLGVWMAPIGRISEDRAYAAFRKQIATLIYSGVDVIILETFSDLNEIRTAIRVAKDIKPEIPVIAQMTFTRDDLTLLGDRPSVIAQELAQTDADVIGVNCSSGPAQLLRLVSIMKNVAPDKYFAVTPNAGWPQQIDGRTAYPASPDYFGEYALAFADAGVHVMGGCCGTTPAHIKAMREALDDENRPHPTEIKVPTKEKISIEIPSEQPTQLLQRLSSGEFLTTVEVAPPRSFTAQKVIAVAEMLRDAGADFVNIPDAPLARMRMSPWAVAYLVQERAKLETVLHFPVRGRNLLRVQGDLLAAHAMNIRNIFVTMGDPTKIGDYPDSFDTHDVVPTGLIKLLHQGFNQGRDQAGNSIGEPTHFTVGAALNMTPANLEKELKLTQKKITNGADFFLSQPIFDPERAKGFFAAYEAYHGVAFDKPIIAGLLPLYTPRHAAFLHNEVPGMDIPPALRNRMTHAKDPAEEGVKIAQEILLEMRSFVQGAYLMPPFGRYYLAAEVIEVLQPETVKGKANEGS